VWLKKVPFGDLLPKDELPDPGMRLEEYEKWRQAGRPAHIIRKRWAEQKRKKTGLR
jgi:hypothetical protein